MTKRLQLILTLITTIIEGLFYSGVVYGWASIHDIFIQEGIFKSNKTLNHTDTADEYIQQSERLNLVYTISTSITPIITILTGYMMDHQGIWLTRSLILLLDGVGYLLIAFADVLDSNILFLAIPLLDIGGYGVLTVNSQIGNLYPKYRSTFITTMCGCFISSSVTFLLFRHLYFVCGVSFRTIFIMGSLFSIPLHIRTFFLMPRRSVPRALPNDYKYGYTELTCFQRTNTIADSEETERMSTAHVTTTDDGESFKKCLLSGGMIANILHFSMAQFGLIYFIGNFSNWIASALGKDNKDLIHHHTTVYSLIQSCGVLVAPVCGIIMDYLNHFFASKRDQKSANIKSAAVSMLCCDCFLMCLFASSVVTSYPFQYITYIFAILSRSFLYGSLGSFVANNYPAQHFGKLYGVSVGVGGLVLLLQYPTTLLASRTLENNYKLIHFAFLAITATASMFPIRILFNSGRITPKKQLKSSVSQPLVGEVEGVKV